MVIGHSNIDHNGLIHSFSCLINYNIHTRTIRTGRDNNESQCALFVYSPEFPKMRDGEKEREQQLEI